MYTSLLQVAFFGAASVLAEHTYPKAFLIGAAKSASTSLFDSLVRHPDVCLAKVLKGEPNFAYKELHFWEHQEYNDKIVGWDRYMDHFRKCNPTQLRIDGTPNQINRLEVPEYLQRLYSEKGYDLDELRFVAILREPCARAFSLYKHCQRQKLEDPKITFCDRSFEEVVHEEVSFHKDCSAKFLQSEEAKRENTTRWEYCNWTTGAAPPGKYSHQLRHWFRYFKPSQFFVFTMDQYIHEWDETRPALLAHLGLKDAFLPGLDANTGSYIEPTYPTELVEFFEESNADLGSLVKEHPEAFYHGSDPLFMKNLTYTVPPPKRLRAFRNRRRTSLEPVGKH